MRIVALETVPYALPFRETYRTAAGALDRRESILVRLRTGEGPTGLGEAVPLSLRGGATLEDVRRQLDEAIGPALGGAEAPVDLASVVALVERCRRSGAGRTALCGADIALHDLAGKLAGVPVAELLGAGVAPVLCNGTIAAVEPARAAAAAAELVEAGFSSIKVKVGTEDDAERIDAVREACELEAVIRADANGVWGLKTALEMDWTLSPLELLEQPCAELDALARVRAGTSTPIVADESVASPADAERAVALAACDATTAKLSKVGGIGEAMRIAELLPTYLSSALDGPVGIAAAAHCASALPATKYAHGLSTGSLFADAPAAWPAIERGSLSPPAGPGLGVVIDEDALARLALDRP